MNKLQKSFSQKLLTNTFWLYVLSYIIAPIGYIIKILLSGELSVGEIGVLYGVISLVTLIGAFNDFGVTESLKYFIPRFINEKKYSKIKNVLIYSICIQVISSTFVAFSLFFFSQEIAMHYFHNTSVIQTLKIFSLFFIGINFLNIITTFFMSIQNAFYSKMIELIRLISSLGFIFVLTITNNTTLEYVSYMWLVGLTIGLIFGYIIFYNNFYKKYLKNIKYNFNKKLFKKFIRYALFVFMGAQAATILSQIDMQMIIYLKGTVDAGYYTVYLSIIGIPFLLLGPIFGLLMPIFSDLNSQNKNNKIVKIKSILTNNFIAIGFVFNLLFFIFAQIIAYILFGKDYLVSGTILQYSILFLIFNFLLQINFNILAGIGKVTARVKIISIAIIINFILNLILLSLIGVEGAALATGIGWIIIWLMSELYLGKKYSANLEYKFLLKNIICIGILGIFSHYKILQLFDGLSRGLSLIYMIIITVTWILIFFIVNLDEFKLFIGEIKRLKR